MTKLPILSGRKLIKVLSKTGFTEKRQKGSHVILEKFINKKRKCLVVPNHKEVDIGTLVEIIRQAGLTRKEFLELLKK